MKLRPAISTSSTGNPSDARGFSLAELAVTLGIGSIVLVVLGVLSSYGLQSFLVMGNSAAMDDQSRLASDQITRELRQATQVLRYEVEAESKTLVLTNSLQAYAVEYSWNAEARTVSCSKGDQAQFICLSDCDAWEATFFQNIPLASVTRPYLPATNQLGTLDLNLARVVSMSWKCSRPVAGSKNKTEGVQTLQVTLRNAAQP